MNIRKSSAKSTLFQIVFFLIVIAALILFMKESIANLYTSGEISKTGMIINGIIFALFLIGMMRIVMILFRYINEHQAVLKLAETLKSNASNPIAELPESSLAAQRYKAVKWVTQQGSTVNQAAMAASANSSENAHLTVIRFVHSTLILAGVFGTVVSLSMALIGAAGLLNSPEGVKEMGTIISSMSSALSSTVTAIVCFFIFAYFYLRLNDARIQVLSNIEDVTSLYLLPKAARTEEGMIRRVTDLTKALNEAADRMITVEHTFINVGDRLQKTVNDLQGQVSSSSLNEIKDLIRKGFHLSEPEYDVIEERESTATRLASHNTEELESDDSNASLLKRTFEMK